MIAAWITDVPGSSEVFRGALVTYATALKRSLLGVAGNLIEERSGRSGWRRTAYRYDHQNQLTEVVKDGHTVRFKYDALGRRTAI